MWKLAGILVLYFGQSAQPVSDGLADLLVAPVDGFGKFIPNGVVTVFGRSKDDVVVRSYPKNSPWTLKVVPGKYTVEFSGRDWPTVGKVVTVPPGGALTILHTEYYPLLHGLREPVTSLTVNTSTAGSCRESGGIWIRLMGLYSNVVEDVSVRPMKSAVFEKVPFGAYILTVLDGDTVRGETLVQVKRRNAEVAIDLSPCPSKLDGEEAGVEGPAGGGGGQDATVPVNGHEILR